MNKLATRVGAIAVATGRHEPTHIQAILQQCDAR